MGTPPTTTPHLGWKSTTTATTLGHPGSKPILSAQQKAPTPISLVLSHTHTNKQNYLPAAHSGAKGKKKKRHLAARTDLVPVLVAPIAVVARASLGRGVTVVQVRGRLAVFLGGELSKTNKETKR